VDNGKFVPDFMTPEYMNAMKFYKRLYDEKLINGDFAATQNAQAKNLLFNGKAGMFAAVAGAASSAQIKFDKDKSGGVAGVIPRLKGVNGKTVKYADPGYNRLLLIPKSSVKTEAEVKKILAFFEHLGDDEMMMTLRYGIEGVHYKMQDGKPVYIDEDGYKKLVNEIQSNLKVLDFTDDVNRYLDPLDLQAQKIFEENEKYIIANPAENLVSQTFTEQGTELETIMKDARTKFIMGELDEQGWKKQVDTWLSRGGQKIIDEYSAAYAKSKAKPSK
jgi:putative aldouronate transport system substrate-binding protein